MADVASKLEVSELDFDTIKTNLKNFLSDQNEFADYDFDASGLSVLLDLLAYNTHYNANYNVNYNTNYNTNLQYKHNATCKI